MLLINVKEEKRRLRKHYRKLRQSCPADIKARLDSALTAQVLGLDEYKSCETLFIFVSSPIECDTSEIRIFIISNLPMIYRAEAFLCLSPTPKNVIR